MPIKHHVSYSQEQDHIIGFKNYGAQRSNKLASYALVFMIKGISQNWKIPIGYYFSATGTSGNKLKELLYEAIDLIQKSGLTLKAVVCDQGTNNQLLFKLQEHLDYRGFQI